MKNYVVLKILEEKGAYFPHTMFYGGVEVRSPNSDSLREMDVLEASAKSAKVDFSHYKICSRIAVVVKSSNIEKAVEIADGKFSVVLDLLSAEVPLSSFILSPVGYVKDLDTGELVPVSVFNFNHSPSFFMHHGRLQKVDLNHNIITTKNELNERYLRSLHWRRNSKNESNVQLQILFDYFAAEALFKESEGENIGGYIRWFMGFPNGKESLRVNPELIKKLSSNDNYEFLDKKLKKLFDDMRRFRNNSVHHGFRSLEFTASELELYREVMIYGVSRSLAAVRTSIAIGITNVGEFKEYLPEIFEQVVKLNDIHGNIIYSLDSMLRRVCM